MAETFQSILDFIQGNVAYAPYITCGLLLLAGFNLPISEDLMLFISGILAAKNPEYLWPLFIGVWTGAYVSDVICYAVMGRYLGNKIFKIKFFAKMAPPEKIEMVGKFYEKYGIWTLIFGRFVPFGVRNALFLTAGLSKMNFVKFAVSDFIASIISCSFFFWLYFRFGETVVAYVKKGNVVIFTIFILAIIGLYVRKKMEARKKKGLEDTPV